MGILIVGLGPGEPSHITRQVWEALEGAEQIWLRTIRHPSVGHLPSGLHLQSFDHLYEEKETFGDVYDAIAHKILELGGDGDVLYAVPGHPLVGEESVRRILDLAKKQGVEVRLLPGLSFIDAVLPLLGVDLLGLQVADATVLASRLYPPLNPDVPALIGQVWSQEVASDLKITLMSLYPDDHEATLIYGAGTAEQRMKAFPLHELDHQQDIDHLTCLFVPPLNEPSSFSALQEVVARLRSPEGCPWDREQDHRTLRPCLLEEAYEALEALDADDSARLCEELGDLLLQVILHAQIAEECGEFKAPDVLEGIVAKLIRRHPHVFGQAKADTSREVIGRWQVIKREEGQLEEGLFADVPDNMPALARAQRIQQVAPVRGLVSEGEEALLRQVKEGLERLPHLPVEEAEITIGKLLFDLVALIDAKGVDAESALRMAVRKYEDQASP